MISGSEHHTPTTVAPPGEAVVWVFDPWAERPAAAIAGVIAAAASCALVLAARLSLPIGGALCVACVGAFAPAIARVECRVEPGRAGRRGLLGWEWREWPRVRRVDALPAGALLSPYARRHWLDGPRALLLPMPARRRGELLARIAACREAQGG